MKTVTKKVIDRITLERLDFVISDVSGVMLVELSGSLDSFNSSIFGRIITRFLDKGDFKNVVFNCNSLSYMASTGVGMMVYIMKTAKDKGGATIIAEMTPKVVEVLDVLGFSSFFDFDSNTKEALKRLIYRKAKIEPKFPAKVRCPVCSKKLISNKEGRFRCPVCKNIIFIDSKAEIRLG